MKLPISGRLAVLALVAALLPPAALLWLSLRLERRSLRDDLERKASASAGLVATTLDGADQLLETIGRTWGGGCDAETARLLRAAVDLGLSLREPVLFDEDLRAVCTPSGSPGAPFEMPGASGLRSGGGPLHVLGAPAGSEPAVLLRKRLPAGWGSVVVSGSRLAQALDPISADPALRVAITGPRGLRLARTWAVAPGAGGPREPYGALAELLGAAPERIRAEVPRFPLAVEVEASEELLVRAFGQSLPILLGVGLAFGAGAAALVLVAGEGGGALTRQLGAALRRGELEVHYLPVVDVRDGRCVGAEALLRWRHARAGLLRPGLFIALAEETGLILPITEWLMRRVARDLAGSLPEAEAFHVSINLAGAHLRDPATVGAIRRIFEGSHLSPGRLVFEVTERELLEDERGVTRGVLEGLRMWGAKLALDDFGTGWANISSLRRFHVDQLKIDRSFVEGIGTGSVAETVVDALVDLGQRLEMTVVAEGVERKEQLDYLVTRGVHLFQGFYFSGPLRRRELGAFVRERNRREDDAGAPEGSGAGSPAGTPPLAT